MKNEIQNKNQISSFMVFFLLFVSITEVWILSFQRSLMYHAGYDSWISVAITGLSIHLIIGMIYKIISSSEERLDLVSINRNCFGLVMGKVLDFAVMIYFFFGAFLTFREYIAVIQVWLFPTMPIIPLILFIFVLLYYIVTGGISTITGLSLWGMFAAIVCILPLLTMVFSYLHPENLKPTLSHSLIDILSSSKTMILQYIGFESLLMFHPFIQSPEKSQKWAHAAVFSSTLIFLSLSLISFMFYSEGQLRLVIWPSLHIYMLLSLPLFQRLEYLVLSIFFITIIANISLGLWAACRSVKRSFRIHQRMSLIVFLILFLVLTEWVKKYTLLRQLAGHYTNVGLYFIYVYIPILFIITIIKKRKHKTSPNL